MTHLTRASIVLTAAAALTIGLLIAPQFGN